MAKKKNSKITKILFSWKMIVFWIVVVATVFIAHHFSGFLELMATHGYKIAWVLLFLWYLLWVGVVGTLMAYILMRIK